MSKKEAFQMMIDGARALGIADEVTWVSNDEGHTETFIFSKKNAPGSSALYASLNIMQNEGIVAGVHSATPALLN
jgi:hypothetical protein